MLIPKKIDIFLYRHLKKMVIHLVKLYFNQLKKLYMIQIHHLDLNNIKRHETEFKWIKFLQSPFPLGYNDYIYHDGYISKMPDFDVFSLLNCKKRESRSQDERKKWQH